MSDVSEYPRRELPDGRWAFIIPLTFGRARLIVQEEPDAMVYDDGW